MYNSAYITIVEKTDDQYFRYPIIIHRDWQWHFARFVEMEQLEAMAKQLGFTYQLRDVRKTKENGEIREYSMDRVIDDNRRGFWSHDELPADAKPIKALSNGSVCTCYFTNDGNTITMYRPNPNAPVYDPMPTDKHIAHQRLYGTI